MKLGVEIHRSIISVTFKSQLVYRVRIIVREPHGRGRSRPEVAGLVNYPQH